jgi:hypothetical protein
VIWLSVRRFKCLNAACPASTFAEQVNGLTNTDTQHGMVQRSTRPGLGC